MKAKNKILIPPSDDEDERINAGIAADPDTYELSADEFRILRQRGVVEDKEVYDGD